jgi:hypothetical protein
VLAGFLAWGTAFIAWIPGATVDFLKAWPGMLNQFLDWIGNAAGPLLAKFGTWAVSFIAWIAPMIPGFIVAIGAAGLALLAWVAETGFVLSVKLVQWAIAFLGWVNKEVLPKLPGILKNILDSIAEWIGKAASFVGSEALKIGKAIIDGIKNGLSNAWGSLTGWLSSKMSGLVDAAMSAIGAHSPSKDFANFVGTPIVTGIIQGLDKTWPLLTHWIHGNMAKTVGEFLTSSAVLVRGAYDIFKSLKDLQTVPTFQPLTDAAKKYADAQQSAVDTAKNLAEVQDQIKIAEAAKESVSNNEKLANLYKEQAELLKLQVDQKKAIFDTGVAVAGAEAGRNAQSSAIAEIAANAQKAYTEAQKQALALMATDAKGALAFFQQRKAQIEELAQLEKDRALATSDEDRASFDTQIQLLKAAQAAESTASTVNAQIQINPSGQSDQKIIDIIARALHDAGISVDIKTRTA